MSEIIKKEDGTEVEVFTSEEVEAQKKEAVEKATDEAVNKYKEDNPDKTGEINDLQVELEKVKGDIKSYEDKDLNFGNLRKQKDAAEEKAEKIEKEIDDKIKTATDTARSEIKQEVLEGVYKDHYSEKLTELTGSDDELKKKIEMEYNRFTDTTESKESITKRLVDAWTLATKEEQPDALNTSVISSGGVAKLNVESNKQKISPEEKQFARKLAGAGGMELKDEDFDKYSK